MPPTIRTLLACILLALVCLAIVQAARSSGEKAAADDPAAGQENPPGSTAVTDPRPGPGETPADQATLGPQESPSLAAVPDPRSVAEEAAPDDAAVPLQGPILLPLNPPYSNQPIEDETAESVIEPAQDEPSQDEHPSQEAGSGEEETQQPTEEQPPDEVAEETEESEESEESEEAEEGEEGEETEDDETSETTLPAAAAPSEPEPKPQLTPAQVALRDRVRRTLAAFHRQPFNVRDNTATEIMHFCLAFGCNTEIYRSGTSGKKVNGITCLCWNYPCAGYEPLGYSEGRIAARVGYGLQEDRGQLLAVLALSRVPPTYPVRVGEDARTVADLVESAKLSCRSGTDLSLRLIALSHYAGDDPDWENALGRQWSLERIVKGELARPIQGVGSDETRRLMALGYAVHRRAKSDRPLEGQFGRARTFLEDYYQYALKLQNSDGSWGPRPRSTSRTRSNPWAQLRATGQVLQWLAVWLPEDQLDDPRVAQSVEYVDRALGSQGYRRNVQSLSTRQIGSLMRALHGLAVYDQRFFRPRTPRPTAPQATKQAARQSS